MARYIDHTLQKRGITCVARLLDEQAPRTCAAVWDALPLGADVYHAKYARNESPRRCPGATQSRRPRGPERLRPSPA